MKTDINIGFIGLGNVYSKFANSLLVADYNLFIYDLDKSKAHDLVKKRRLFLQKFKRNLFKFIHYHNMFTIT